MELRDYLAILWLRWRTVASCVVVVTLLALIYSVTATPMYIARASVFFSVSVDQPGQLSGLRLRRTWPLCTAGWPPNRS
jgi:uncharacterized protein involved in exopolysaccharide biosynthesis